VHAGGKLSDLVFRQAQDEDLSTPLFTVGQDIDLFGVYGANLNPEIGILDANYSIISYSKRKIVYSLTSFSNKGLVWMGVNGEGFQVLYPVADGQPIVTALSANGVSAGNNTSSTIRPGESYNFVFTGSNLDGMTTANLNVPAGSTAKNFAASANKVSFTLDNAQAGDISLDYNGSALFRVTLIAYSGTGEGEVSITSIDSMSNGATYDVTGMTIGKAVRMRIEGSGLSNLENADFVQMRGNSKVSDVTFTLEQGDDTLRYFTWYGTFSSGDKLVIQKSGTTLFTLNVYGTMHVEF
jgi:hypothetical protein